jgi:hypothetical protein
MFKDKDESRTKVAFFEVGKMGWKQAWESVGNKKGRWYPRNGILIEWRISSQK